MKFSPVPDWGSHRRIAIGVLIAWLISCLGALLALPGLVRDTGDTDDALRLSIVRDLAAGRGWFDVKLVRLQPPRGLYMHWSRLLDGAEATLLKLFALALPPGEAELAMRAVWPTLCVLPVTLAVLLIARRLGGGRAVFLAIVTAAASFYASGEFTAGRIDHHSTQIACCLLALAAAAQRPSPSWAAACGLASATGLAIGLEAAPFLAIIGVAMGLGWALGRTPGRVFAAFGATLGGGALVLHLAQTPPSRLTLPACDALAINLAAGLGVMGAGIVAAAALGTRASIPARAGLLGAVGLVAAGVCLALDPLCLQGPMAAVDPSLKRDWLANVDEMTPWLTLMVRNPGQAVKLAAPAVVGLASWLWLGRRAEVRIDPVWRLVGALLFVSLPLTLYAARYVQYPLWFAAPISAVALADFAQAVLSGMMVPAVVLFAAVSMLPGMLPGMIAGRVIAGVPNRPSTSNAGPQAAHTQCTDTESYRRLARLPAGLVLSEIDQGSYILANTHHSALQAPYHRMGWGIQQAQEALGSPPSEAERRVRSLGIAYILDCPAHADHSDRHGLPADSLQKVLDAGRAPSWLEPLSQPREPLQIYRVR